MARQSRSRHVYALRNLLGEDYEVRTLSEAFKTTLLELEKPGFFEEVYYRRIAMGRCQLVGRTRKTYFRMVDGVVNKTSGIMLTS